jgi:hypothetical protein
LLPPSGDPFKNIHTKLSKLEACEPVVKSKLIMYLPFCVKDIVFPVDSIAILPGLVTGVRDNTVSPPTGVIALLTEN